MCCTFYTRNHDDETFVTLVVHLEFTSCHIIYVINLSSALSMKCISVRCVDVQSCVEYYVFLCPSAIKAQETCITDSNV